MSNDKPEKPQKRKKFDHPMTDEEFQEWSNLLTKEMIGNLKVAAAPEEKL